jgi:hypothetical protein
MKICKIQTTRTITLYSMKMLWSASSLFCLFFGIYFITVNITQNIRYHGTFSDCWYEAYGQIDRLEVICDGSYDGFILGMGLFAIGILIVVLNGIKKNQGDLK